MFNRPHLNYFPQLHLQCFKRIKDQMDGDIGISRHMRTDKVVEDIKPREKMTMKITTITKELSVLDEVNLLFCSRGTSNGERENNRFYFKLQRTCVKTPNQQQNEFSGKVSTELLKKRLKMIHQGCCKRFGH